MRRLAAPACLLLLLAVLLAVPFTARAQTSLGKISFSAGDGPATTSLPGSSDSTAQLKADGLPPGLYSQVLAAIQKDASPDYNVYLTEGQADNGHRLVRPSAEADRYLAANASHGLNTIFAGGGIQVTPLSQGQTNEAASWQWGIDPDRLRLLR